MNVLQITTPSQRFAENPDALFRDTTGQRFAEWVDENGLQAPIYEDVTQSGGLPRILDGFDESFLRYDMPEHITPTFKVPGIDDKFSTRLRIIRPITRDPLAAFLREVGPHDNLRGVQIEKLDPTQANSPVHKGQLVTWYLGHSELPVLMRIELAGGEKQLNPPSTYWQSAVKTIVAAHATLT